jgi:acyl carrier protein
LTRETNLRMLEEIMNLAANSLQENTILKQLPQWDSIAKILLMADVEDKFKKLLTGKELNSFKTPADILDYIEGAH